MSATFRYGQAAVASLVAFLQAQLPAMVATISTEEGWQTALDAPAIFRKAITPSPTEPLGVEVDCARVERYSADGRNNLWECSCTVRIFVRSLDGEPEITQLRARAYGSALLRVLYGDAGLSSAEIDAEVGSQDFSPATTKAAGGQLLTNVDTRVVVLHQET